MDDPAEFGAVFDRHAPAIFRFAAHRLGREAAEDVLADTFTRAFAARDRAYMVDGSLRAWLYKIASNLIADELRRRERSASAHERLRAHVRPGAQFAFYEGVATTDPELLAALESLRDEEREALLLLAWGELSYAEIAVVTGVPIGTVRSRLSRARAHVRAALDASASEVA
ncbi:MAG TPA: RNA polymerase sigma factor [Gemmatimonadaceae bacterium]|nr:RNA polymerase sigma factor [Gemmatimonadaceae bacterium]